MADTATAEKPQDTSTAEKPEETTKTENTEAVEKTDDTKKNEDEGTKESATEGDATIKTENSENAAKTDDAAKANDQTKDEDGVKAENDEGSPGVLPPKAFVGNLPPKTPVEELKKLFEPYGPIVKCDVVKRWGFVRLTHQIDVERAIKDLHKTEFKGSTITVEPCKGHRTTKKPKESNEKKKDSSKKRRGGPGGGKKKWAKGKNKGPLRDKKRSKKDEQKMKRQEMYIAKRREAFMRRKQNEQFGPPPMQQGFPNNGNMLFNRRGPDNFPGPYDNYGGGPDFNNFDNRRFNNFDNRDLRFMDSFDNRNMNMGMGMRDAFNGPNDRFQGNYSGGHRTPPPFDRPPMDNRMFDRGFDNNRGGGPYGSGPGPDYPNDNRFNQDQRSFRDNRGPEPLMDAQRNMPSYDRGDNYRNRMMGGGGGQYSDDIDYQDRFGPDNRNMGGSFSNNRGPPEPLMNKNIDNRGFMGGGMGMNKSMDSRGMGDNFSSDMGRRDSFGRPPLMDDRRPLMDDSPRFDKRMGGSLNEPSIPPLNQSRLMDNSWNSGGGSPMSNNRGRNMDNKRSPPHNFNDERSRSPFRSRSPPRPLGGVGQPMRSPPRSPLFDRRNQSSNEIFHRRMPDNNSMNRGPSGNMGRVGGDNSNNRFAGGPGNKDWRGPPRRF